MQKRYRKMQKDTVTIKELEDKLAENESKLAEKENELAERERVRDGPQEETWRRLLRDSEIQTLQLEKHYTYSMDEGTPTHPHARKVKKGLGSFHPRESSLNLEWTFRGGWLKCPKTNNNKAGPDYFNYWVGRIEPYVDTDGELRRAFAYGDNSDSLLLWYSIEEMQAVMEWSIPENSPWANLRVWDKDRKASPTPKGRQYTAGSAPRGSFRGTFPRGRTQRGRPYSQGGRGRSQSYQTYRRDESRGRYSHPDPDWHQESPERYSSGVGRSSGGTRESRRDTVQRPGHRESRDPRDHRDQRDQRDSRYERDESKDRRDYLRSYRGRDRYDSRPEEHYSDESSGRDNRRREGRRDYGSERARAYGYRNT